MQSNQSVFVGDKDFFQIVPGSSLFPTSTKKRFFHLIMLICVWDDVYNHNLDVSREYLVKLFLKFLFDLLNSLKGLLPKVYTCILFTKDVMIFPTAS